MNKIDDLGIPQSDLFGGVDDDLGFKTDGFSTDLLNNDKLNTGVLSCYEKPRILKPKKCYYENAQDLIKEIEIGPGMQTYCIVSGNFIYGDVLESLIIDKGLKVKNLHVATLSLSENNVDSFVNIMLSGQCESLHLILSSYFYSHERHNLIPYIYNELENKGWDFTLSIAGSHMKIALIETDDYKLVIHGSANLRSSANIEQLMINEDGELYDFNLEYCRIIEKSYRLNKKAGDRRNKLWKQLV